MFVNQQILLRLTCNLVESFLNMYNAVFKINLIKSIFLYHAVLILICFWVIILSINAFWMLLFVVCWVIHVKCDKCDIHLPDSLIYKVATRRLQQTTGNPLRLPQQTATNPSNYIVHVSLKGKDMVICITLSQHLIGEILKAKCSCTW